MAVIHGTDGHDTIYGTTQGDVIFGGMGADTLRGSPHGLWDDARDILWGGQGFDTFSGDHSGDEMRGGKGRDYFLVTDGDLVYGGRGHDRVEIYQDAPVETRAEINLGRGDDTLVIICDPNGSFNITVNDFKGNDALGLCVGEDDKPLIALDKNGDRRLDAADQGTATGPMGTGLELHIDEGGMTLFIDGDSTLRLLGAFAITDSQLV